MLLFFFFIQSRNVFSPFFICHKNEKADEKPHLYRMRGIVDGKRRERERKMRMKVRSHASIWEIAGNQIYIPFFAVMFQLLYTGFRRKMVELFNRLGNKWYRHLYEYYTTSWFYFSPFANVQMKKTVSKKVKAGKKNSF